MKKMLKSEEIRRPGGTIVCGGGEHSPEGKGTM